MRPELALGSGQAAGPLPLSPGRSGLLPFVPSYVQLESPVCQAGLGLESEWERWDAKHGFAGRTLAGVPTIGDRERLEAGGRAGRTEAASPPGFAYS
jgi:hypothetical protein